MNCALLPLQAQPLAAVTSEDPSRFAFGSVRPFSLGAVLKRGLLWRAISYTLVADLVQIVSFYILVSLPWHAHLSKEQFY